MPDSIFLNKNIVLCVCGSIAAYKSADLVSSLRKCGANINVVITESAKQFITPLTLELLSGNPVSDGFFDQPVDKIPHIDLAKKADIVVIAPATADFVARAANGYASDLTSAIALSAQCPIIIAPAMNTQMLDSAAYKDNVVRLKTAGKYFIEPDEGSLVCGDKGKGRLASIEKITGFIENILTQKNSLKDRKFLVTYGPTVEKIDDMRFISNYSSGLTGYHLVRELMFRGAEVTVVAGPNKCERPMVSSYIEVESAAEMLKEVAKYYESVDCIIMAAAVADFTVKAAESKLKRSGIVELKLTPTDDILKSISKIKRHQINVGFCAESENLLESAGQKLAAKNLDLVVANMLGDKDIGPGAQDNEVYLVSDSEQPVLINRAPKQVIASKIIDYIASKYF